MKQDSDSALQCTSYESLEKLLTLPDLILECLPGMGFGKN